MEDKINIINNETCPFCGEKQLTLLEEEREIPYFGIVYLFSMNCSNCKYHKADIESAENKPPVTISYAVDSEEDMNIRVVKSASATVKFPRIMTMESNEMSNGYVTNIEGLFNRAIKVLENVRDSSDDKDESKKAKNHLKKLQKVMWGHDSITITIDDPTGNSAIIGEKAVVKTKKK